MGRKLTAITMVFLLVFSLVLPATGQSKENINEHWASQEINKWIQKGLATGYEDGSFRPNNYVTRAEFMTFVNRAFNFTDEVEEVKFTDVEASAWYSNTVRQAIAANYIGGYEDGTLRPNQRISRQEVAVILNRILGLEKGSTSFQDSIPVWSKESVEAITHAGIMKGYPNGTFKAEQSITRAEVIVTLDRVLTRDHVVYNESGVYGPMSGNEVIKGNVRITSSDVTLQNVTITGDLTIDEEVGEGDVFIKGVTVQGDTHVNGGGQNSVYFENTNLIRIFVSKKIGKIRVVMRGKSQVKKMVIESETRVELNSESKVEEAVVDSIAELMGEGTIEKAVINISGVRFEKAPLKSEVKEGVKEPSTGKENLDTENPREVSPAIGGGSGGGSSTPNYTVTFNSNGGSEVASVTASSGSTITSPQAPTKDGYSFDGWYKEDTLTDPFDFSTAVTSNMTLYAKWTINVYTVTFNSNGGSEVASVTASSGSTITSPQAPTKEEHSFDGWYKEDTLTDPFDFSTTVTSNMTLYAKWQPNVYTLTTQLNNSSWGSVSVNNEGPYEENTQVELTATAESGTSFKGWTIDGSLISTENPYTYTMLAENKTIVANFIPNDYIPIATADELNNIRNATLETYGAGTLFEGTYTGGLDKNYMLVGNIDLGVAPYNEVEGWVPINIFTGIFDGRGHTISNLTISRSQSSGQGLFGAFSGTVRNVALTNVNIAGGYNTGSLVVENRGTVENCYVTGTVVGNSQTGGLVGTNKGSISNTFVYANVVDASWAVGGLVGYNDGEYHNASIVNSYAMGSVIGKSGGAGIAGYAIENSSGDSLIKNTFSLLTEIKRTEGTDSGFGSITYYLDSWETDGTTYYSANLENNYALNTIAEPFTGAFNEKGANNAKDGADIIETDAKSRQTYLDAGWSIAEGDVNAIWDINEGVSYPYLKVMGPLTDVNLPSYYQQIINTERDKLSVPAIGVLENGDNALTKAQALVSTGYTVSIVSSSAESVIALDGTVTGAEGVETSSEVVFRVEKDGVIADTLALTLTVAPHITQALVDAERDKITVAAIGELFGADNVLTKAQNLVSTGYTVSIASSTNQSVIRTDGVVIGSGEIGTSDVMLTVSRDGITSNTSTLSLQVGVFATYTIGTNTANDLVVNFNTTVGDVNQTWNVTGSEGSTVSASLSGDAKGLTINVTDGAQTNESFTLDFAIGNNTSTVTFAWDGAAWTLSGNYLNRVPTAASWWKDTYTTQDDFYSPSFSEMTQNITGWYSDPNGDTPSITISTSTNNLDVTISGGFLMVKVINRVAGTTTVTLTIDDLKGGTIQESFDVLINN